MKRRIAFLISLLLIAFIPFALDVYFTTPDDPRYIALVSGAYTGTPEKELVYVGSILGLFEAILYSFAPDFEWYSIVYYLCTLFAFSTILWQVLVSGFTKWKKVSVFSLVIITQVYLSLTPQFTTLATQLSFASFILMLSCNGGIKKYWIGLFLFFLATQVRLAASLIPYLIACPLFLKDINLKSLRWWKEKSWVFGILLIAAVSFTTEKIVYSSEGWKTFTSINDARGYVADNPMAVSYSNEIKNEKDRLAFDLYYRFRIFDLNILTPEKLQEYQETFEERAIETISFNTKEYFLTYWKMGGWMVVALAMLLIIELIRKRRWDALLIVIASISMFILANLQMMSMSFAKERVMLCSYVVILFSLLYMISTYLKYSGYIITIVCLLSSIQYLCKDYGCLKETMRPRPIIAETEMMIEKVKDSKVMLTTPTYLTPEAFHTSESPIYRNSVIQGWMHFYPKGNLSYQPFTAYIDGIPLLVNKDAMEQVEIIRKLLKLHYNIDADVKILNESDHYNLVQLYKE